MALSDLIILQAKATDTLYTLPDGDGLGLTVTPVCGTARHFRYYWLGKQKRISLNWMKAILVVLVKENEVKGRQEK